MPDRVASLLGPVSRHSISATDLPGRLARHRSMASRWAVTSSLANGQRLRAAGSLTFIWRLRGLKIVPGIKVEIRLEQEANGDLLAP